MASSPSFQFRKSKIGFTLFHERKPKQDKLFTTFFIAGYPRLRLCPEGSAAAAAKAHDPTARARRHPHPMPVALLRRRRKLVLRGHLENSPSAAEVASAVSTASSRPLMSNVGWKKRLINIRFSHDSSWKIKGLSRSSPIQLAILVNVVVICFEP